MLTLLIMMTASGLHSQNDSGKLWINRQDALRKLAQADSLSSYKLIVANKQKDIDLLQQRIAVLQDVIKNLNDKDAESVAKYNAQLKVMQDERLLFMDQLNGYEKLLRKEKRKRFWTGLLGVATTLTASFLFITK